VLVLGFANLVADGISMGFGDYVSSSTEKDVVVKERAVTEWDITHHSRIEQQDLLRQYQALGMDINDATMVCLLLHSLPAKCFQHFFTNSYATSKVAWCKVVNIFAKYKDIMVGEKMVAQKGMLPLDEADKPWKAWPGHLCGLPCVWECPSPLIHRPYSIYTQ